MAAARARAARRARPPFALSHSLLSNSPAPRFPQPFRIGEMCMSDLLLTGFSFAPLKPLFKRAFEGSGIGLAAEPGAWVCVADFVA